MLRLPLVVSLLLLHFATSFLWDDLLVLLRDSNDSVPGVRWYSNNSLIADTPDGAFVLPMNDRYVSNALLRYGQWEKPLLDLVCAVLDAVLAAGSNDNDGRGIVILDVGSNVGAWAVPLARRYAARGGRVFAYEPQIDLLMYLSATSLLNALENIVPVHAAVTNVTGWSRIRHIVREKEAVHNFAAFTIESLNVNHTSDASGGETSGTGPFKPLSDTSYVVPHVTLDDLFYQQGAFACPSLIKLDIEIHELYALIGAQRMIRECQPVMLIEASCRYVFKSLFTLLDHLGYAYGWVVLPLIEQDVDHFGRTLRMESVVDVWRVFNADNVLAVPAAHAALLSDPSLANVVFPIDMTRPSVHGYHSPKDLSLTLCLSDAPGDAAEPRCHTFDEHVSEDCAVHLSDRFLADYWQSL